MTDWTKSQYPGELNLYNADPKTLHVLLDWIAETKGIVPRIRPDKRALPYKLSNGKYVWDKIVRFGTTSQLIEVYMRKPETGYRNIKIYAFLTEDMKKHLDRRVPGWDADHPKFANYR